MVSQSKVALFKALEYIDFVFDKYHSCKYHRIMFQCYTYLLKQYFSISIGRYQLYVTGPWNSELVNVGHEICRNKEYFKKYADELKLKDEAMGYLYLLKSYLGDNSKLLEIYTTYRYLINEYNYEERSSKVIKRIKGLKDHLIHDNINDYMDKIFYIDEQIKESINHDYKCK